jgi:hypothetical protein
VYYARHGRGNEIPKKFEHSIQSAFNQHNKDSTVWRKKANPKEALFYCPGSSGSGWWAVDQERAREWLVERNKAVWCGFAAWRSKAAAPGLNARRASSAGPALTHSYNGILIS